MSLIVKDAKVNLDRWILDLGANICIINNKKWFTNYRNFSYTISTISAKESLLIEGNGTVSLFIDLNDSEDST